METIKTALVYALLGVSLAVASLPVRAEDDPVSPPSLDGGNSDNAGQGVITGLRAGSEGVENSGPLAPDSNDLSGFGQNTGAAARDLGGLGHEPEGCGESLC